MLGGLCKKPVSSGGSTLELWERHFVCVSACMAEPLLLLLPMVFATSHCLRPVSKLWKTKIALWSEQEIESLRHTNYVFSELNFEKSSKREKVTLFFSKSNELKPHSSFDSVTRPRYNATFGFERFEGRLEICQNPHCLDGTKQAVRHTDKKESKIVWLFTELPIRILVAMQFF